MPEVLFAGGGLDSVEFTGAVSESTTAAYRNTTYCDSALFCFDLSTAKATCIDTNGDPHSVVSGETWWGRADLYVVDLGATHNSWTINDSSGHPWIALRYSSGWKLFYNSGSGASPVWTQLFPSAFLIATGTRYTLVMRVTLGSPHEVEFFINGTSQGTQTFTQASFTNVLSMTHSSAATSGGRECVWSQLMMSEGISLVGSHVYYRRPNAAGSNSGWAGAYTDIDEAVLSDADFISAASDGLKSTFGYQDVTLTTDLRIESVFLFSRGKNDGNPPENIKPVCRSGGVDYAPISYPGIGLGYLRLGYRFDTDPNTSSEWTETSFNSAEFGVESAA